MGRAFFICMLQKHFAFNLLALAFLLVLGSCILFLSSCSSNPNRQTPGEGYLQGEWQQQPGPIDQQLVNYTLYSFKFSCDSFFVSMQTHSKVNYGADTCMNKGLWTEYAKGKYVQHQDTVVMKGFFCNADYSLKNLGGCFRAGVYEDYFKTVKQSDSLIKFTSTSSVLPLNLRLIKRTNCVPKPL
jgi:hypothetical protein